MKKFKFVKPFSSFPMSVKSHRRTLKENWYMALHDPAYLLIFGSIWLLFLLCLLLYII